jgi:hypothetical protein
MDSCWGLFHVLPSSARCVGKVYQQRNLPACSTNGFQLAPVSFRKSDAASHLQCLHPHGSQSSSTQGTPECAQSWRQRIFFLHWHHGSCASQKTGGGGYFHMHRPFLPFVQRWSASTKSPLRAAQSLSTPSSQATHSPVTFQYPSCNMSWALG